MAKEGIKVTLQPVEKERASPGEVAINVILANGSDSPVAVDLSHAHIPSLVLEIKDPEGRPVLLPPPPVPKTEDAAAGPVTLAPGEAHRIVLTGFLDAARKPGRYQVRFRQPESTAGAAGFDAPVLASDWVPILVPAGDSPLNDSLRMELGKEKPKTLGFVLDDLWKVIWDWLCRLWYWLRCFFSPKACNKVASAEVDRALTETISNAAPPNEAWNGTYGWHARFQLTLDQPNCRITVTQRLRISGAVTPAQQTAWKDAIEAKWSNTFKLCCREDCCATCCPAGYTIACVVQFVANGEHHGVNAGGSTTSMTDWGTGDTVDVTHEFGHMLGNKEEYFTVDGTDFGLPRQPGGNIMNNPANGPVARHFDLVREEAEKLIGTGTKCTVKGVREAC
jgi:hypothetical protein